MIYATKQELIERGCEGVVKYRLLSDEEKIDLKLHTVSCSDAIEVYVDSMLELPANPHIWYRGNKKKIKDLKLMINSQRLGYSFFVSNAGMYKLIKMGDRGIVAPSGEFIPLSRSLNTLSFEEYYDACRSLYKSLK